MEEILLAEQNDDPKFEHISFAHPIKKSVLTIIGKEGDLLMPAGTSFIITADRLMMTARHVIDGYSGSYIFTNIIGLPVLYLEPIPQIPGSKCKTTHLFRARLWRRYIHHDCPLFFYIMPDQHRFQDTDVYHVSAGREKK